MIKFKKSSVRDIYIYLVLIILIYTSGSIYNFVYYDFNKLFKIFSVIIVIPVIITFKKNDVKSFITFNLLGGIIFFFAILAGSNINTFIGIYIRIASVFIFYMYCMNTNIKILEYLYKIIIVIAVIYLFFWFIFDLGFLSKFGKNLFVLIEMEDGKNRSWMYTNFFNFYFRWKNERRLLGLSFKASNGPFWEPGLYQVYLNFSLLYELFYRKKRKPICVIILVVAIISSTSTMGLFTFFLLIVCFVFNMKSRIISIIISIPCVASVFFIIFNIWQEKVVYQNISVRSRSQDTFTLLYKYFQNPIIGNGVGNTGAFNSLLLICVDFGLLGVLFMGFIFYKIFSGNIMRSFWGNAAMAGWLGLSLINEPIIYHSLPWLIFFVIIKYDNKRVKELRKIGDA